MRIINIAICALLLVSFPSLITADNSIRPKSARNLAPDDWNLFCEGKNNFFELKHFYDAIKFEYTVERRVGQHEPIFLSGSFRVTDGKFLRKDENGSKKESITATAIVTPKVFVIAHKYENEDKYVVDEYGSDIERGFGVVFDQLMWAPFWMNTRFR